MKTLIKNSIYILWTSLFLFACGNSNPVKLIDTEENLSFSYRKLSDEAKLIAEVNWKDAKTRYSNHLNRIHIFLSKDKLINESEARKLINVTSSYYATVLTRDAKTILEASCESKHSDLNAIEKELEGLLAKTNSHKIEFNANEVKSVKERIEKHNEILSFINNIHYQNLPVSLDKDYDTSYNSKILAKKKEYEKENFSCTHIKNGLASVPQLLNNRHISYINEMVTIYNKIELKTKDDYIKIVGYFDKYCYQTTGAYLSYGISRLAAEKQVEKWMKKIDKPEDW